jgi:hypothetical protein
MSSALVGRIVGLALLTGLVASPLLAQDATACPETSEQEASLARDIVARHFQIDQAPPRTGVLADVPAEDIHPVTEPARCTALSAAIKTQPGLSTAEGWTPTAMTAYGDAGYLLLLTQPVQQGLLPLKVAILSPDLAVVQAGALR